MSETTGTTVRVLSLLRLLSESPRPMGVKDVAGALGLPMSSAHRLLDALLEAGFVEKDPMQRRYSAGSEFFRIASLLAQKSSVARAVQPLLDELTAKTGESSILSLYLPGQHRMTFAAKCDSPQPLRYRIELFEQKPLEWGASSLAILAFLPERVQAQVFDKAGASPVTGARLDRHGYFERLARVRLDGYAMTEGEKIPDSIGIAVPLTGAAGTVLGSLSITTPKFRFDRAKAGDFVRLLRAAARRFSGATAAR